MSTRACLVVAALIAAALAATAPAAAQSAACTASPSSVESGDTVTLDASASTGADGYRYDYEGDGSWDTDQLTSATENTTYDAGTYEPRVKVLNFSTDDTDTAGCGTVAVDGNDPPAASIAVDPRSPAPGEEATLDASGSSDEEGEIVQYTWRIDGEIVDESAEPGKSYTFREAGDYLVGVTVVDGDGASDSAETTVTVEDNAPPNASLAAEPSEARVGESVAFDASGSTDPDGLPATYAFDVDGDGEEEQDGTESRITRSYDAPGNYTVTVTVTDDDGGTATANATVTVTAAEDDADSPPANGSLAPTVGGGGTVRAGTAVTMKAGSGDSWPNASYSWRVDGEPVGTGPELRYTFDDPGDHSVEVRASGPDWNRSAATTVGVAPANGSVNASLLAALDADDDGRINDTEVLTAVEYWNDDATVPGTDGARLTDTAILHVIEAWRTGAPVGG